MFKIAVDGRAVERALANLDEAVRGQAAEAGMRKGAERAAEIAQGYAPVDTGRLRSSIKVAEVSPHHAKVHADPGDYPEAYYAQFVEHGTRYMAPQPFMRPTTDIHGDEIGRLIVDAIAKAAGL